MLSAGLYIRSVWRGGGYRKWVAYGVDGVKEMWKFILKWLIDDGRQRLSRKLCRRILVALRLSNAVLPLKRGTRWAKTTFRLLFVKGSDEMRWQDYEWECPSSPLLYLIASHSNVYLQLVAATSLQNIVNAKVRVTWCKLSGPYVLQPLQKIASLLRVVLAKQHADEWGLKILYGKWDVAPPWKNLRSTVQEKYLGHLERK